MHVNHSAYFRHLLQDLCMKLDLSNWAESWDGLNYVAVKVVHDHVLCGHRVNRINFSYFLVSTPFGNKTICTWDSTAHVPMIEVPWRSCFSPRQHFMARSNIFLQTLYFVRQKYRLLKTGFVSNLLYIKFVSARNKQLTTIFHM